MTDAKPSFRQRLQAREFLVGTMLKTPTSHATEILSNVGFDFVVVDQEHSPFDRGSTDVVLMAARGAGIPILVRVPMLELLLPALDGGASGVIVPHVSTVEYAKRVAAACRHKGGERGYATSTRAGGYTTVPMVRHLRESDAMVTVIAQIEDVTGLEQVDAIAAVDGIDSLFIGRNDLAVSLGEESVDTPAVRNAVERIANALRSVGKPLGMFVTGASEVEWLKKLGATGFVVSSDHGFLRQGAAKVLPEMRAKFVTP